MKRAMKLISIMKVISIILIVCLSVQAAGPLQFAPRPAAAEDSDWWFNVFTEILDAFLDLPISAFTPPNFDAILGYVIDELIDKYAENIPILQDIVDILQIFVVTTVFRLIYWNSAKGVEFPAIAEYSAYLALGGLAASGAAAIASFFPVLTYLGEWGVLAAIKGVDENLAGIQRKMTLLQSGWDDTVKQDYNFDHQLLLSRVFKDNLTEKYGEIQAVMLESGISYGDAAGVPRKFDTLNPGYGNNTGLYIDGYKENAENWKEYTAAYPGAAEIERSDFASLSQTINELANASRGADGYTKAIQARAQTYAFAVQQAANLRHDIARQIDMRARQALDRQQRRADLHAAFGRASEGGASWASPEEGY